MKKKYILAHTLRWITATLIVFSITVTYFVIMVQNDYDIITNPEGPELEE